MLETILTETEPILSGEEDDAGPSSDMPVGKEHCLLPNSKLLSVVPDNKIVTAVNPA